jgi:hypothetical protein
VQTAIHEVFLGKLSTKITNWILNLQSECTLPDLVSRTIANIDEACSTQVGFDVDCKKVIATKSPDGQYRYLGHRHAPFVLEVAYSAKVNKDKKDLSGLAQQYYEDSDGQIKTVLTVDLEYTPKQKRKARLRQKNTQATRRQTRSSSQNQASNNTATSTAAVFSFYRGADRIISNQCFRDQTGKAVQGGGLTLHITDFLPDTVAEQLSRDLEQCGEYDILDQPSLSLHLAPQQLFDYLVRSEAHQEDIDRSRTTSPTKETEPLGKPSGKKRRVNWASDIEGGGSPRKIAEARRTCNHSVSRRGDRGPLRLRGAGCL